MSPLQQSKLWVMDLVDLPKDALHIYVGLFVFLAVAVIFRRPIAGRVPILAVLAVAFAGELWDVIDTINAHERIYWWRNWHDVWNTMFWPAILFLLARYTRLFRR
jgi:hypothetical protein